MKPKYQMNAPVDDAINAVLTCFTTFSLLICERLHHDKLLDAHQLATTLKSAHDDPTLPIGTLERIILKNLGEEMAKLPDSNGPSPNRDMTLRVLNGWRS